MVRLILLIASVILSLSFAAPLPTSSSVAIADSPVLSAIPDLIVIERDASAAVPDNTGVGGSGFRLKGGVSHRREAFPMPDALPLPSTLPAASPESRSFPPDELGVGGADFKSGLTRGGLSS